MEAKSNDPYEQQLFAVFESCLEKGQTKLSESGLRNLSDKLQLEELGDALIASLLSSKSRNPSISFTDFRNGLVKLLDASQNSKTNTTDLPPSSPEKHGHWPMVLEGNQRLRQFCGKFNGIVNGSFNSDTESPVLSKQLLQSFFEKVDMDCDGLINFEDTILLLQTIRSLQDSLVSDRIDTSSIPHDNNSSRLKAGQTGTMLGSENTGFIRRNSVINLWEIAGVTGAANLLSELGFTSTEISLTELATILSDEIKSLQHEPISPSLQTHMNLLKGALVIYQEEVRSVNTIVDQLRGERDKLRIDIAEANERANLLAQEIDENHVKLEKSMQEQMKQLEAKHTESIREISHQSNMEREAQNATIKSLTQQLQNLQQEEQQIRTKLVSALNENQTLEFENQNYMEQIAKLKHSNNQLLLNVQMLAAEHDEVVQNDERENQQMISLVDRIKSLQAESALLRDQNDELTMELEALKSKHSEAKNRSLDYSKRDYSDGSEEGPNSVTDSEPLAEQAPELKANNLRQIQQTGCMLKNEQIIRMIGDLKGLLDDADSSTCANSDSILKDTIFELLSNLESAIRMNDDSRIENIEESKHEGTVNESPRDLLVKKFEKCKLIKRKSTSDGMIHTIEKNFNNLDAKNGKSRSLRDYPPRKEEEETEEKFNKTYSIDDVITNGDGDLQVVKQDRDRLNALLREQEIKYNNEKRVLQEQIFELEKSLDSLKTEYYQCEDYWVDKLEEERQLIEQEQKITDEKLAELITKIAEYEEQFSTADKSRNDGHLLPIEENVKLEQQYTDLQEEFEQFRGQNEELLAEKDKEIIELEEKVAKKEVERTDIGVQTLEDRWCLGRSSSSGPGGYSIIANDMLMNPVNLPGASPKVNHYGINQKLFEPGKLNQIAEHSVTPNDLLSFPPKVYNCCCHQVIDNFSIEGEIQRLHQKKIDIENECNMLMKQKETFLQDIIDLQSYRAVGRCFTVDGIRKSLTSIIQSQEQKIKSLQSALRQQKACTEQLLDKVWKQHKTEVENIQAVLKDSQECLQKQIQVNSVNIERLGKTDLIMKDLYIENAFLKKQIERDIAAHRHIVSNCSNDSTSV